MGQYFRPIILKEKENSEQAEQVIAWMYSHNYGNGLKLMEHSWLKNDFVNTFESLLAPNAEYHKSRVVWAGDYAEDEENITLKDDEGKEYNPNLYSLCNDENEIKPNSIKVDEATYYRYILNHTKNEYVDKDKIVVVDGRQVHPLPLLTSEGNGQGGGDYFAEPDQHLVGAWARDVISVQTTIPNGFNELIVKFAE